MAHGPRSIQRLYLDTPKRNGYRSIHTSIQYGEDRRIEIQIRSEAMHEQAENGLAAHWSYKQGDRPDGQASWLRDLIEILETTESPEELLEHTRMAMYQDRIFAFTPAGELIQLPKGATVVDFAFEVHTDLGKQTVGAKGQRTCRAAPHPAGKWRPGPHFAVR